MSLILKNKSALAMVGLTLYGSLMVTTAFAGPPKKKPAKKPAAGGAALIAAGKKVYKAQGCAACHAIGGVGGTSAPDLSKVAAEPKHNAKWLETQVKNPKTNNPDSTMPPYEDKIKGKDLTAIVAYLASLKK